MSTQPKQNTESESQNNFLYALGLGSELGFLIVIPLAASLLLGLFLDRRLGTFPFLLLLFVFSGLIFTVVNVRYLILPFLEKKVASKNKK